MQMKEKKEKRIIIYKFPTPKRKKKKLSLTSILRVTPKVLFYISDIIEFIKMIFFNKKIVLIFI